MATLSERLRARARTLGAGAREQLRVGAVAAVGQPVVDMATGRDKATTTAAGTRLPAPAPSALAPPAVREPAASHETIAAYSEWAETSPPPPLAEPRPGLGRRLGRAAIQFARGDGRVGTPRGYVPRGQRHL